jgi:hypothetical protein
MIDLLVEPGVADDARLAGLGAHEREVPAPPAAEIARRSVTPRRSCAPIPPPRSRSTSGATPA